MTRITKILGFVLLLCIKPSAAATGQWVPEKDVTTTDAKERQEDILLEHEKNVDSEKLMMEAVQDVFVSIEESCPPQTIAKRNGPVNVAFELPRSKYGEQISFESGRVYRHVIEDDICYNLTWSNHSFECNEATGSFIKLSGIWPTMANAPAKCENGSGFVWNTEQPNLHVASNLPLTCAGKKIDVHNSPIHVRFDLPEGRKASTAVSFNGGIAGRRIGDGNCIQTQWTAMEFECDSASLEWRVASGFWNTQEILNCESWEPGSPRTINTTQEFLQIVDTTDQLPCQGQEVQHENGPIQVVMQLPSNFSLGTSLTYQAGETYQWYKDRCFILQWSDHTYLCDSFIGKWQPVAGSFLIPDQLPAETQCKAGAIVNGKQKYLKIVDLKLQDEPIILSSNTTSSHNTSLPRNTSLPHNTSVPHNATPAETFEPTLSPILIQRPPETTAPQEPTSVPTTAPFTSVPFFGTAPPVLQPSTVLPNTESTPTGEPTISLVISATSKPTLAPAPALNASTTGVPTLEQTTMPPTIIATAAIPVTARPTIGPQTLQPTKPLSPSPSQSTGTPTQAPTISPSVFPSLGPASPSPSQGTATPTQVPTIPPSVFPSLGPPSASPSQGTATPTQAPTIPPSVFPSLGPSSNPSGSPSDSPSGIPSIFPSISPSTTPNSAPSKLPSSAPSVIPPSTAKPSPEPTLPPSTAKPTRRPPTGSPTRQPTFPPTTFELNNHFLPMTATSEPTIVPSSVPSLAVVGMIPNPSAPAATTSSSPPPTQTSMPGTAEETEDMLATPTGANTSPSMPTLDQTSKPTVTLSQNNAASSTTSEALTTTSYYCGCPLCTEMHWNKDASGFSCGQRIEYIAEAVGGTVEDACQQVAGEEFPDICGPFCDPNQCASEDLALETTRPGIPSGVDWTSPPSQAPSTSSTLILVTDAEKPTPNLRPVPVSSTKKGIAIDRSAVSGFLLSQLLLAL